MQIGTISTPWSPAEWTAFGTVLVGLGAVIGAIAGGIWTLLGRRKDRRAEAARWRRDVFRDFYLNDRFREIKLVMEYEYSERLARLLEQRVSDPDVRVLREEMSLLEQLDMFLNYFEFVLHLESEGHLERRDQQAVFEYWFELMAAEERTAVREYASHFGFERVDSALSSRKSAA
jgi:hypothetical protein